MKEVFVARRYRTVASAPISMTVARDGDQHYVALKMWQTDNNTSRIQSIDYGHLSREGVLALADTLNQVLEDWE